MSKQEDELIKQFLEKLKRPNAELSNQQTSLSLKRSRQAEREAITQKRRPVLNKKDAGHQV